MESLSDMLFLAGAGLVAGIVNALAGGGSLISFPALLALGIPSVTATVTNTVALWPGYLGSVLGYRKELTGQRRRAVSLGATSAMGAVLGSLLLLVTPEGVFDSLVPVLVGLASVALLLQPQLKRMAARNADAEGRGSSRLVYPGVFLGGVYGAYFTGGMGVLLLGILGVFVHDHLQRVNAVRSVLSLTISTVAMVAFALFGPVSWNAVAVMAVASLAGGLLGTRVARMLSPAVLRGVIVAFGLTVSTILAVH
jgi:uncharacterized membrane protein YfcA